MAAAAPLAYLTLVVVCICQDLQHVNQETVHDLARTVAGGEEQLWRGLMLKVTCTKLT